MEMSCLRSKLPAMVCIASEQFWVFETIDVNHLVELGTYIFNLQLIYVIDNHKNLELGIKAVEF